MLSLNKKKITHSKSVVSAEEEKLYRLNKNFFLIFYYSMLWSFYIWMSELWFQTDS